jgi:hypothetical protein
MNDELSEQKLRAVAAAVRAMVARRRPGPEAAEVAQAVEKYRGRRRCDAPGRDQMVYRLGSAMEAVDALDIPCDALAGFWDSPKVLDWLNEEAVDRVLLGGEAEGVRLIDLFRAVLADPARRQYLIEVGVYSRFRRDLAIYRAGVEAFATSKAAEREGWRHKRPTAKQMYLIDRIVRAQEALGEPVESPLPCSRGVAHDWIRQHGGNPRFWNPPAPPEAPPMAGIDNSGDPA